MAILPWMLLVLQFDGSLRRPKDPVPVFGSGSIAQVGACGAAILLDDGSLVALGGKSIPCIALGVTSGDAEYDALNFALEWLCDYADAGALRTLWDKEHGPAKISVSGDCKTVIDHLNGVALPRKMRPKYEEARSHIDHLSAHGACFSFQSVPRDQNVLCDTVCHGINDIKQVLAVSKVRDAIKFGEELSSQPKMHIKLPQSSKRRMLFTATHFSEAVMLLSSQNTILPISTRTHLYVKLLSVVEHVSDPVALRRIGKQLQQDCKQWPSAKKLQEITRRAESPKEIGSYGTEELMYSVGIMCDAKGLSLMGLNNAAEKLLRKKTCLDSALEHNKEASNDVSAVLEAKIVPMTRTAGNDFLSHALAGIHDMQLTDAIREWYSKSLSVSSPGGGVDSNGVWYEAC